MKLKELPYELAKAKCKKQMVKYDYSEIACKKCPLYLNDENFCGLSFAFLNKKYGNKEINFKECE